MSMQDRPEMDKSTSVRDEPEVTMRRAPEPTYTAERPVTWAEMRALLRGEEVGAAERTWRPPTGGILSIIAGSWNLLIGIAAVFGGTFLSDVFGGLAGVGTGSVVSVGIGSFMIILGLISIVGGAVAIRRRMFGLALAGSITALFPTPVILPFLLGILSIIFITLGHREFGR